MKQTKGERAKTNLMAAAAAMMQRQGFHGTGLADIVGLAGAPRGSLYFHFPGGKEELAIAAIAAVGTDWRERIDEVMAQAPDAGAAIGALCLGLAAELEASDWAEGSPLAIVALESAVTSEEMRGAIAAQYRGWTEVIAKKLEASGAAGMAGFVLAAIEGGLLLARVERSQRPLVEVAHVLRALVAMPTGANRVA